MAGISLAANPGEPCQIHEGSREAEEKTHNKDETAEIRTASAFRPACHLTAGKISTSVIFNAKS